MSRVIISVGDPTLRATAENIPIADITSSRIRELIRDMKTVLAKEEYGVAIAAPQVGESLRLFVVSGRAVQKKKRRPTADAPEKDAALEELPEEDETYINPVLVKISRGHTDKHEGCLSIRGKWGMVPRAEKATVRAYNEKGEQFTRGASGFLAHIFQHEMDHLDGILYIDKATEVFDEKPEDEKVAAS